MKRFIVILAMGVFLVPSPGYGQEVQTSDRPIDVGLAEGIFAPVLSIPYFPVKLAVSIVGGILGGISGWATGGNERAAEGIWRPTMGGTYWITPEIISHERPFLPFDGGPYAPPPSLPPSPGSTYMQP